MYNKDELSLFYQKARKGLCSHAYIVDGAKGIGKLSFALECARAMLCASEDKPCGNCPSCKKALGGDHPDIHVIGKEKNALIGDVREIIRLSSLKPNDGDKQIFIICNAGKLGEGAQNALLKIIEEPPETVAIFMLVETRSSLLPTVLSRGQRIHLDGMRDDELRYAIYEKNRNLTQREIDFAVDIAAGNFGEAEKYFSKESIMLRNKAEKLFVYALNKNSYELTAALIGPRHKREPFQELLNELVFLLNEAQKKKYGTSKPRVLFSEEVDALIANASKTSIVRMCEVATIALMSVENSSNLTAVSSKLSIDLLNAATR